MTDEEDAVRSPDDPVTRSPDLLLVGRVARAHGNKGHVIVNIETDFAEDRFVAGKTLIVEQAGHQAERKITSVRFHQGRPIVALDGVESMNDAEALAGAELKMPASALAPLPARTFYRHDLVGCEVRTKDGQTIGKVTGVEGPLERSLLLVAVQGGEAMIPMVEGIIVNVDTTARLIVVNLPEGLIERDVAVRTSAASEPRDRSEPAKRRARARAGESEGR